MSKPFNIGLFLEDPAGCFLWYESDTIPTRGDVILLDSNIHKTQQYIVEQIYHMVKYHRPTIKIKVKEE